MDAKMLARLGAIVFAAVAITATAIELTRKEQEPSVSGLHRVQGAPVDPLRQDWRSGSSRSWLSPRLG